MLLSCCLNDLEVVPFAPVITGIISVFTFHMRSVSVVKSSMLVLCVIYHFSFIQGLHSVDGCTTSE
jgi:hypothetical protein